jgi:hypothetical protein
MGALTEHIFSHAVALQQSGRLRNNIFVNKRNVYILNMDHTVILNFTLPSKEPSFDNPVAFSANDYDSEKFHEEGGKIIFTQKNSKTGVVRTKSCAGAEIGFEEIEELFSTHYKKMRDPQLSRFSFERDSLSLLEENLSHLEIKAEGGKWSIIQRDIYTGVVIELKKPAGDLRDDLENDFGPVGIRTNDFLALFSFNDFVTFYFPSKHPEVCLVKGNKYEMKGVLAGCVYDELGTIETIKEKSNGRRQEPQDRRGEQEADSASGQRAQRSRRRRQS